MLLLTSESLPEGAPNITPLTELAERIGQSITFVKGAAWARGWTLHEVGAAFCLCDKDRDELFALAKRRPVPMKKQAHKARATA